MKVGSQAPDFLLTDKDGVAVNLSAIESEFVVIYFYPKDDTPGCTIEGIEFSACLSKLKKLGATVIGISGGDDASKAKFCAKHKLKVTLLSDTDLSVSKAYGAFGEKSFMGRRYKGILRKTFVVSGERKLVKIFDSVTAKGHAAEVVAFLESGVVAADVVAPTPKVQRVRKGLGKKRAPTK